jgi:hypothetical protein
VAEISTEFSMPFRTVIMLMSNPSLNHERHRCYCRSTLMINDLMEKISEQYQALFHNIKEQLDNLL